MMYGIPAPPLNTTKYSWLLYVAARPFANSDVRIALSVDPVQVTFWLAV